MYLELGLNLQAFGAWDYPQPAEPHLPGQVEMVFKCMGTEIIKHILLPCIAAVPYYVSYSVIWDHLPCLSHPSVEGVFFPSGKFL